MPIRLNELNSAHLEAFWDSSPPELSGLKDGLSWEVPLKTMRMKKSDKSVPSASRA